LKLASIVYIFIGHTVHPIFLSMNHDHDRCHLMIGLRSLLVFIISHKEVMFSSAFDYLFVSKHWSEGGTWATEESVTFWW